MNRAKLRSYAPKARKDFLQAVSDRARKVGLTLGHSEPVEERGDVAVIGGQAFPKRVAGQRRRLDEQIKRKGFTAVMEEAAYTWFNRLIAIRYMELHGYLEHGYRVLSDPSGKDRPQILEQAENVTLPGVDKDAVIDLKLDGTKDEELYKLLLLGQCHALHLAMPFLFERIDDQTELLLPDNLLASDSVIRKLVADIDEEDWEQVEIIGWLYQFYITEEKARVDAELKAGKPVTSRDIPAKTQLFTPNWIVKYLVQNSLGRQWLATYPQSPLRGQMEYYIELAEQTEEVKAKLADITPKELDPEALTLIDPAVGSGHILVEAYDLFKEIYLERGYRLRDIPRLILEKNLFGLEIDDRAAQMAGFALLMKARADDRRILDQIPILNVRAIQSSAGLNAEALASSLLASKKIELVPSDELFPELNAQPSLAAVEVFPVSPRDIAALLTLFAEAKTFGSLLTIPAEILSRLPRFREMFAAVGTGGDLLIRQAAEELEPLVAQAELLGRQYDVSVMNPPYLGGKGMNLELKAFAAKRYPNSKSDLFAMFIERGFEFVQPNGFNALVTMQSWMFLSSYETLRDNILASRSIEGLVQMSNGVMGIAFGTVATIFRSIPNINFKGTYSYVGASDLTEGNIPCIFPKIDGRFKVLAQAQLHQIPGKPIAYWISDHVRSTFSNHKLLGQLFRPAVGMNTGNNERFLRQWFEIDYSKLGLGIGSLEQAARSDYKWFPYNKGGKLRKWFGNCDHVINYSNNGEEVKALAVKRNGGKHWSRYIQNLHYMMREGITWSDITTGGFAARITPKGFLFDVKGSSGFTLNVPEKFILALLCSPLSSLYMEILNPTNTFQVGDLARMPVIDEPSLVEEVLEEASEAIEIATQDWNYFETAWEFQSLCGGIWGIGQLPSHNQAQRLNSVLASFQSWITHTEAQIVRLQQIEQRNLRLFVQAYGLEHDLHSEISTEQITLARVDREKDMRRLISYALGCMMGRYSLDKAGLIYAYSGNEGFDPSRYTIFPADTDGILPLTDADWFGAEDTANRFGDFLKAAWPAETYHENVKFVADSLSPKAGEPPMDTIRRYLATGFYKDHMQTYKKRPIYWMFSSGKERAFQALVYLHRYNEGTLARMRMEYVVPLQSRLSARIEQLDKDIAASTSTADRKKRESEKTKLARQYLELIAYDEKLRHYADQRISLDLDDGVKVNYGKFGDLLAEVKAITGDKDE
jgi:hypothetical protein